MTFLTPGLQNAFGYGIPVGVHVPVALVAMAFHIQGCSNQDAR